MVCSEILLPPHVPTEYADRETLWNAVEKIEQHPKAQLAYSMDFALQNEFSMEENIALARQFLLDEFVSRGMIVDFAVHRPDREDGGIPNPHVHVLCPIRPIEPDGAWGAKQHRVYVLDEDGNRVRDEEGNYVFNAVPTTDWGRPETLEHWREKWAEMVNARFAEKGLDVRIDHRSYERQGIDQLPTVHEGPAVRQMEAKGIPTDKGSINRLIRTVNALLRKIRGEIGHAADWIREEAAELRKPEAPSIAELLGEYYAIRDAGAYSNKAKVGNLKRYAQDFNFLQARDIVNVEQLGDYNSDLRGRYHKLNAAWRKKSERMKELDSLIRLADDYARLKPIVDDIPPKGGFGKKREKYMAEHDGEIRQYYAVRRKLDNAVPDKKLTPKAWKAELDKVGRECSADKREAKALWDELKVLNGIRQKVETVLHDRQRSPEKQKKHEYEL